MTKDALSGPRVIEVEATAMGKSSAPSQALASPRVILSQEQGRVDIPAPDQPASEDEAGAWERARHWSVRSVAGLGIVVMIVGVTGLEALSFVERAFAHGTVQGGAAIAFLAAGLGGLALWFLTELRGLWGLREVEKLQRMLNPTALPPLGRRAVLEAVAEAGAELDHAPELRGNLAAFHAHVHDNHSAAQVLSLFESLVLEPADALAESRIRRASAQAFGMGAISPTVLTDTLFFLARGTRLLRDVARAYGHRPGVAGTVLLLRRLFVGTAMIAAADAAGDLLAQKLGGSVLEKLSARAAESSYAALRMARLGVLAMQACRPVPFLPQAVPSATQLFIRAIRSEGAGSNQRG